MNKKAQLSSLKTNAILLGALAAIVLTVLAVIQGFKDTDLITNATADLFITGLTIFATFAGVLALAIVGKTIVGLFKKT